MARCSNCGSWKFFFQLNDSLCSACVEKAERVRISEAVSKTPPPVAVQPPEQKQAPAAPKPKEAPEQPKPVVAKKYRVTGMDHYMDNLMSIATENDEYELTKKGLIDEGYIGERVWKYDFYATKVEIVPEPENPVDPKAIKVIVDGAHVGYIKAGSCAHLLKVIREKRIKKISCEMFGGPYKYIEEEYDYERDKEVYTLERGTAPYAVHLTIEEE